MSRGLRHLFLTAWIAAAVLAFSGPAVAADDGAGARFHVVTSLGPAPGDPTACGVFAIYQVGSAQETQIGSGSWAGRECWSLGFGGFSIHGDATLTAPDGAQLSVDYDETGGFPVDSVVSLSGTFTITGGTGRFSGSTGGGTISGANNVFTGVASDTLEGTIRLGNGA
jgi:hypothetical protein